MLLPPPACPLPAVAQLHCSCALSPVASVLKLRDGSVNWHACAESFEVAHSVEVGWCQIGFEVKVTGLHVLSRLKWTTNRIICSYGGPCQVRGVTRFFSDLCTGP